MLAAKAEAFQRAPRSAGAAGNRRTGVEGEFVGQRHQRVRWAFHVAGMCAVAGRAVHLGDAFDAELLPSGRAMRTDAAAAIMVLHDALADPRLLLRHAGADLDNDTARLVAADHGMIRHLEAE